MYFNTKTKNLLESYLEEGCKFKHFNNENSKGVYFSYNNYHVEIYTYRGGGLFYEITELSSGIENSGQALGTCDFSFRRSSKYIAKLLREYYGRY